MCNVRVFICLFFFAGHHTIYIGVHVPKSYRRRRRHRRRTSHKDRKEKLTENASDKSDTENNDESSNSILKPLSKFWWTSCQGCLGTMSVFAETQQKLLSPVSGQKLSCMSCCVTGLFGQSGVNFQVMAPQITVPVLIWLSWVQCLKCFLCFSPWL